MSALFLTYWLLALLCFFLALFGLRVRRQRYHSYAFKAWQSAAQNGQNRTPEDFVVALANYDRAMKHVTDKEKLLARYERDPALTAFLEQQEPGLSTRAMQRVREALEIA